MNDEYVLSAPNTTGSGGKYMFRAADGSNTADLAKAQTYSSEAEANAAGGGDWKARRSSDLAQLA